DHGWEATRVVEARGFDPKQAWTVGPQREQGRAAVGAKPSTCDAVRCLHFMVSRKTADEDRRLRENEHRRKPPSAGALAVPAVTVEREERRCGTLVPDCTAGAPPGDRKFHSAIVALAPNQVASPGILCLKNPSSTSRSVSRARCS